MPCSWVKLGSDAVPTTQKRLQNLLGTGPGTLGISVLVCTIVCLVSSHLRYAQTNCTIGEKEQDFDSVIRANSVTK